MTEGDTVTNTAPYQVRRDPTEHIQRITVAEIAPRDIVMIHIPGSLSPSEARTVEHAWYSATELPNRVVILPDTWIVDIAHQAE